MLTVLSWGIPHNCVHAEWPNSSCMVHSLGDSREPEDQPSSASISLYNLGHLAPPQFTHVYHKRVNVFLDLEPFFL